MASTYASCAKALADNLAEKCSTPLVGGYTGRAFIVERSSVTLTLSSAAGIGTCATAITLGGAAKTAVIDNLQVSQPFNGSNTQSNADDGFIRYRKTVSFMVPLRGSSNSEGVIEPLANRAGFILVAEKRDTVGNGSYEIIGAQQPLVVNEDGILRNEYENGGSVQVTMSCNEPAFECTFYDTDYATTKAAFETLLAASF